ncbi:PAS domain S-box protein [Pedobacter xixiisoli]|uniref:histidine kinase n=1 Tax=Pedobacter xixiisoli TaxID=1476464 RepID=A0A285ZR86_9SPHI|nr:PAS domain S-box protein [Pedobacter xixiisoli]SOD12140.1 PAS domain S-box-containing protein [Pedobacter xixiisoli]
MIVTTANTVDLAFLQGGGDSAQLILAADWNLSPLGIPQNWSNALKQALSMVLLSNVPAFVCWGERHLLFYNDAFKLAYQPNEMGQPIEKCLAGDWTLFSNLNSAEFLEDLQVNVSPLRDHLGNTCGVLGIGQTKNNTSADNIINDRKQQINEMVASAPFPIGVYVGREMKIAQANDAIIAVWGKGNDVIGKNYREILPELEAQLIYSQLEHVFDTGIPFHARNQQIDLMVDGELKTSYFNYSFTPLHDIHGNIYGVMSTAADVTDLVVVKQQIENSGNEFRNMIAQAPVAMCLLLGPLHKVALSNASMLEVWDRNHDEVIGKPLFEVLPDTWEKGLAEDLKKVYETGKTYQATERPIILNHDGEAKVFYLNFVCKAYRGVDGEILGMLAISVDVTDQVLARRELERAYEQTKLAKEAGQLGTFDLDVVNNVLQWDSRCRELFGAAQQGEVNYERDFVQGLHIDDRDRITKIVEQTLYEGLGGGEYDVLFRTIGPNTEKLRWVRAKGKVYFDEKGKPSRFIGTVLDVTDQQYAELRVREVAEKQARLAAIVNSSDDIIISKQLDGTITSWNGAAERKFGYSADEAIGKHISLVIPKNRLDEEDYIISQIRKGNNVDHFDTVRLAKDGTELQLSITVSPIVDINRKVIGASKIARDISAQVDARAATLRYTERLEVMNMVSNAISEELDLNSILQKVTDASTELTGAKFGAFFYNRTDENGDSYLLYTLSGASKEAFEQFGMPRDTAVFHPTFAGEGVVRVDDITQDPRYGKNRPYRGMPKGHLPVVSYLAVPVISRSGKVIGGLFFGHPEPARFTAEHESLVVAIASQAAIGVDNAMLYEKVLELNDKKDEFIGLASHELKTPLASINGYLQILNRLVKDLSAQKFLGKASLQVRKITSLVNDLLDVSKIEAGKLKLTISSFDLKTVVEDAVELIKNTTQDYEIVLLDAPDLCMVEGDGQRIEQVVINLLSNAIKYSPGTNKIEVKLSQVKDEVLVGITDFGLGIAADKIKNLFSRFYRVDEATPNISGLGIGLYLSHEIISRHKGKIWVDSELGKGSTFWFSLPCVASN